MNILGALYHRELMGYFRTPVAYVFLVVFLLTANLLPWFAGRIFESNEASLQTFFIFLPWVYLFLVPAIGMRLWSEERRSGTWELLLTMPLTMTQAVLAKFLAGWTFLLLATALTFPLPLSIGSLGPLDAGPVISGYLGAGLVSGACLALCALMSALTKNQVIAFVLGTIVCFGLLLIGTGMFNQWLSGLGLPTEVVDLIANFSYLTHFEPMLKGILTFEDILFFLSLIGFGLLANVLALERT